jgi:hypothetical protein
VTIGQTTGTYNFGQTTAASDLVIEAFDRCGIRPASLTREQLRSAYRSCNFEAQTWANRGVNMWEVKLLSIPLIVGQSTYGLPIETAQVWDVYVRQFQTGATVNLPCLFSTTMGSPTVTVTWPAHGLSVGAFISLITTVSVGGLILVGNYQITTVPNGNQFTIAAASSATATVTNGGAVATFTSAPNSATITVTLANHGLFAGQPFNIQVQTLVSDVVLFGTYTVQSVLGMNQFTITGPNPALITTTVAENGGLFQIAGQTTTGQPTDRLLYPISRNDYAAIPNKSQQGTVTTFWYNRQTPVSQLVLWQLPTNSGPQTLQVYVTNRLQDVSLQTGATVDMPYRFTEAFTAGIAARFAQKFAPALFPVMKAEAMAQWKEAEDFDSERVPLYLGIDATGYWNA